MKLHAELRSSTKGLINIKNEAQKGFLWYYVRHINPIKIHPERITPQDKDLVNSLNYDGIEFPVREKDFRKIEIRNNICITVFGYENGVAFPIYVSEEKFENFIDLLLVFNDDKSHYVYIKDFDRYMFHKTKNKNKKYFCKSSFQCFGSKIVLKNHKELMGAQSVRLVKRTIEFKNYFKQRPVPFKIYVNFESDLESVEIYGSSNIKNIRVTIRVVFLTKLFVLMIGFSKPIAVFGDENAAYEFVKAILKEYEYCKKIMKKHFNKNLIMSEEEEQFQSIDICWICEKLIDHDDETVRDQCHVTGKFRGAAHWDCNINLRLSKKVPVIFQNLRGYGSHLVFNELKDFDVKIDVIPNGLERYMAFF